MHSIQDSFVGRDRQMAELRAGLEEARAGHGRFFLVCGEPGIGKTRLAEEIADTALAQAIVVLRAGCWDGGGAPAYWPFIQLIRAALDGPDRDARRANALRDAPVLAQLIPELQPADAGHTDSSALAQENAEQARFELFDAAAATIRSVAALQPLLLILEDLHDSDQPSLLMLRFVVGQLKNAAVMVVATYRDVEVQRPTALSRSIGDLLRESTQLPLPPLSREDTARMIADRAAAPANPRLVSDIHQASAGNPLFIDGLVRVLAAEGGLTGIGRLNLAGFRVPDGVREAIRRWLDLLPDRSLLTSAAAIAQEFELRCLQRVTRAPNHQLIDAMADASGLGIVTLRAPGRYRFTHALIRNALSDELNSADRAAAHLKIGEAIEQLYPADIEVYAAALADHFREGGDVNKAIDYSIRAGEAARLVFAYEEAIAHWQAALELMPDSPNQRERRADLLERSAELLGLTESEGNEQFKYLRQALKIYQDVGRPEAVARAKARIAGWLSLRGAYSDVSHDLGHEEADENLLRQTPEGATSLVWRYIAQATAASLKGHTGEALAASRRAMAISEELRDEGLWARASITQGGSLFASGRLGEALTVIQRASDEANRLNDNITGVGNLTICSYVLIWLCDPIDAVTRLERELRKARMAEASLLRGVLFEWLQLVTAFGGKLPQTNEIANQMQSNPPLESVAAFYRGEWDRAEVVLGETVEIARQDGRYASVCSSGHWLARVRRALGDLSEAQATIQQNLSFCIEAPLVPLELHARAELASINAEAGRPDLAHPHLDRCREVLAAGEDWRGFVGHVARAEAVVAAAEGRFEDAQSDFARAVEIYRRYQVPFEQAEAFHYWGRAMIAAGNRAMALDKLDAATELYRRHGAGQRWIDSVQLDRLRGEELAANADQRPVPAGTPSSIERSEGVAETTKGPAASAGTFRLQGEFWTLSWSGSESRLKDRKGLHYIAWLLRHPGRELGAAEMLAALEHGGNGFKPDALTAGEMKRADIPISRGLGDAGPALDSDAKAQYRRRLRDLREELALAEQHHDLGRTAHVGEEIGFIEGELASAIGLGGRDRKAASHSERARLVVTKAIKAATAAIRTANPELGRHLSISVRTGNVCVYLPGQSITWQL